MPAAVLTTETVLESVDVFPALSKTADDGPSPPAHSVSLVIPPAVDDVDLCLLRDHEEHALGHTQEV